MKFYQKRLNLWPHQKFVRSQMDLATENSIICQPTGTGKSFIICDYILDKLDQGETVAIIVPKVELIENLEKTLRKISPQLINYLYSPICSNMQYKPHKRLYISTYGSFSKRYQSMLKKPTIFIHDEAHHAKAKTWESITKLPGLHFGFTATPIRLDGRSLSDLFPGFIDTGRDLRWFIDQKYLADFDIKTTFSVDFDAPKGFDNLGVQAQAFDKKQLIGDAVDEWKKHALGLKTVVFTTGKQHSQHVLEAYTEAGIGAVVVDSDMNFAARKEALQGFGSGKYLILINTAIVTEGVDIPDAACCQLLRFTQSVSLYHQMIGRVLRAKKDGSKAVILDHAGNVEHHLAPDMLIDWREIYYAQFDLIAEVKKEMIPVSCELCNHTLYQTLSMQPFDLKEVICENCNHLNFLTVRKKRELIETVNSSLHDFKLSKAEQAIYKIASADSPKQVKAKNILKLLYLKVSEKDVKRGLAALYGGESETIDTMILNFKDGMNTDKSKIKTFLIGEK